MQLDAHVLFLFGVCVKSSWSALTQSFSILLSAYGLANFIYVQLDLNLVDEEEMRKPVWPKTSWKRWCTTPWQVAMAPNVARWSLQRARAESPTAGPACAHVSCRAYTFVFSGCFCPICYVGGHLRASFHLAAPFKSHPEQTREIL